MMQKTLKMTETLAHGYSSERTQQELSHEYLHNRISEEGLKYSVTCVHLIGESQTVQCIQVFNVQRSY